MISSGSVTFSTNSPAPALLYQTPAGVEVDLAIQGWDTYVTSSVDQVNSEAALVVGDSSISVDYAHGVATNGILISGQQYTLLPKFRGALYVLPLAQTGNVGVAPNNATVTVTASYTAFDNR